MRFTKAGLALLTEAMLPWLKEIQKLPYDGQKYKEEMRDWLIVRDMIHREFRRLKHDTQNKVKY